MSKSVELYLQNNCKTIKLFQLLNSKNIIEIDTLGRVAQVNFT